MDLTGTWRAAPAEEALRREFHLPGFDDESWERVAVPGHWSTTPALADASEVLYRTTFESPTPPGDHGQRSWLELDGLFYQGDIYLDGEYLGDTEGYFVRHAFDVTRLLSGRSEHQLAAEVGCSPAAGSRRRAVLGVYEGDTDLWRGPNPGGIWAPVRIRRTGPVRIDSARAVCTSADAERAEVALRVTLDAPRPTAVRLGSTINGFEHDFEHRLAEGVNEVEWSMTIPEPALWWPHRLGDQPLYEVAIEVSTDAGPSDERKLPIGLRSLSMRQWQLRVNGERIHAKGVNMGPTTRLPAASRADLVEADLRLALDAGMDLVRPYGHVAPTSFYETADRLGLLVWQDLPLVGAASNSIRRQAMRQAAHMVNDLGHHPCIAVWNGHVAPAPDWMEPEPPSLRRRAGKVLAHQAPTWSKTVLDRSIRRVIAASDGSRPNTAYTGVIPHLPRIEASPTHLWFGWRRGTERDLAAFAARLPSQVRWVAEMGAQSIPDNPEVTDLVDWPRPEPGRLAHRLGYEESSFDRYVPPTGHLSLDSWVEASQLYQAGLLRRQIEALRRLKYRPNGGFCVHFLADSGPAISASLVDHERHPKLAYASVAEACRPVIVVADRLPVSVRPGEAVALDVHVVSDLTEQLADCVVEARLTWPGGSHRWRFGGAVAADSVTRVGTLSWMVPDSPGLATLHLELSGAADASNRYDTTIRSPGQRPVLRPARPS